MSLKIPLKTPRLLTGNTRYAALVKMAAVTKWRIVFLTICFTLGVAKVESSADVMKKLTTGFATALEKCKNEVGYIFLCFEIVLRAPAKTEIEMVMSL